MKKLAIITALSISLPTFAMTDKPVLPENLHVLFQSVTELVQQDPNDKELSAALQSIMQDTLLLVSQTQDSSSVQAIKEACKGLLENAIASEEYKKKDKDKDKDKENHSDKDKEKDKEKDPEKQKEKEAKIQAALTNLAAIAGGVATIVHDPHDKPSVSNSIGSILSGLINIAFLAHKPRQPLMELLAVIE